MPVIKHIGVHSTPLKAIEYVINGDKTDKCRLVSGINISTDPKEAYEQFRMNFEMHSGERFYKKSAKLTGKKERIRLHHYIQSFAIGEISPETANEIGKKWAQEFFTRSRYGVCDYQILVCTHKDRQHIHNHILVSAYDLNGMIWRDNMTTLKKARSLSDKYAKEYGLSVIEKPKNGKIKPYSEVLEEKRHSRWKVQMQYDIDKFVLLPEVKTLDDLRQKLEENGYETSGDKYLHIKRAGDKKRKPMSTMKLGDGYATEELLYRIKNKNVIMSLYDCGEYKYELARFAFYLRQTQYYTYRNIETDVNATYRQTLKICDLLCFLSENNIHFFSGLKYEVEQADDEYRRLKEENADEKLIAKAAERRKILAEHYNTYLDCMETDYDRIVRKNRQYYEIACNDSGGIEIKPEGITLEINYFSEVSKESVTPQSKVDTDRWYHYYDDPDEVVMRDNDYDYYKSQDDER